jgi:hypothetical protein
VPTVLGWAAGGLIGVVWVMDGPGLRCVLSGYAVATAVAGSLTKPLFALMLRSLAPEAVLLSTLYLLTPLLGAAAALAYLAPDPIEPSGSRAIARA